MPAMVRRTGKPSPSKPAGAVDTASTGRSTSPSPAPVTRGRVRVSAVTAVIRSSLPQLLRKQLYGSTEDRRLLFRGGVGFVSQPDRAERRHPYRRRGGLTVPGRPVRGDAAPVA